MIEHNNTREIVSLSVTAKNKDEVEPVVSMVWTLSSYVLCMYRKEKKTEFFWTISAIASQRILKYL